MFSRGFLLTFTFHCYREGAISKWDMFFRSLEGARSLGRKQGASVVSRPSDINAARDAILALIIALMIRTGTSVIDVGFFFELCSCLCFPKKKRGVDWFTFCRCIFLQGTDMTNFRS